MMMMMKKKKKKKKKMMIQNFRILHYMELVSFPPYKKNGCHISDDRVK
jgi:hypothetical protein